MASGSPEAQNGPGNVNRIKILFFLLCFIVCGCVPAVRGLYPPEPGKGNTIFVVSHGWHTGIVISYPEARPFLTALKDIQADIPFLEIGWGDAGFYQAKKITSGLTVQAIFWPTDSVMHVVALPVSPESYFTASEVVPVRVSGPGLKNMLCFIDSSFARDAASNLVAMGLGLYGESRFFRANGKYYALNTCNSWTAQALRSAGLPVSTFYALTEGNVMYQVRSALEKNIIRHEKPQME